MRLGHTLLLFPLCMLACDAAGVDGGLAAHTGALLCSDLETVVGPTTLEDECQIATIDSVTATAESAPIRASIDRVYEALTNPEQFGAFPRPLPPDFEPPPVPHSVAIESAGAPFLEHFRLFYGGVQTSTISETHTPDSIEIVQLWRVNPLWTEEEVRLVYPALSNDDVAAIVGTPFMDPGLRTIVTFTIHRVSNPEEEYAYVSLVQHGLPARSYPIVKDHWTLLYFSPLKAFLEGAP